MSQYMVKILHCQDCKQKWAGNTDMDACCHCGSKNLQTEYFDQGGEWENSPKVKAYQQWCKAHN